MATISKTLYEVLKAWQDKDGICQQATRRLGLCTYTERWLNFNDRGVEVVQTVSELKSLLYRAYGDDIVPFDYSLNGHIVDMRKDLNPGRIKFVQTFVEEYENENKP